MLIFLCFQNGFLSFKWLDAGLDADWVLVADARLEQGAATFDAMLKSHLVITVADPASAYPDVDTVWAAFDDALGTISGILSYEPVFKDYMRRGFEEFLGDNVQVRVRGRIVEFCIPHE